MRRSGACLTLLALLAIAGCGGGGSTASTSTAPSTTAKQSTATATQKPPPKAKSGSDSNPANPVRQHAAEGEPAPGAKAVAPGVPVTKGGDNSIQSFGAEGQEEQRTQALAELRSYLAALRDGESSRACALASREYKRDLAKLVAQAKGKDKPKGCAQTLEALLGGFGAGLREAAQVGELLSFRVEGKHAYLIYRGAKGQAMFIAMANDGGQWKVNVLQPESFSETTQAGGTGGR